MRCNEEAWRGEAEIVYLIGNPQSSLFKIGRTVDVTRRLGTIQSMSPVPLAVLWTHSGGRGLESNLHRHFAIYHSHGEWYNFGDEDAVALVEEAVASNDWTLTDQPVTSQTLCAVCRHEAGSHRRISGLACSATDPDGDSICGCRGFATRR
ncbi:GIY-YIG nuclease family protein [Nonomuraea sp. SYSU D8015]|uniref:GIY-YIG nuclease family protein n=1 Tax=Nonomuraea sp. SYSU D8015 TaxID=2593644 RepID=UPI0016615628